MKKIFKGLSVLVASTALCAGIATATACSGGYNGKYIGTYDYESFGQHYGMVVEVTVENNVITKVRDITNTEAALKDYQNNANWHVVSEGWVDYYCLTYDETNTDSYPVKPEFGNYGLANTEEIEALMPSYYQWTNSDAAEWTTYESKLLQQYEGKSVTEILEVQVFINEDGVPYDKDDNEYFSDSELVITGASQSSGRLMLAVQNALGKTTEIGRIG